MFRDIYATTPCAAYNMSPIYLGVREAAITRSLRLAPLSPWRAAWDVRVLTSLDKTTPVFAHPITMKMVGDDQDSVVFDARAMSRVDRDSEQVVVTAVTDYEFALLRASLQLVWVEGHPSDLSVLGDIVLKVFTRWLSQGMAKRLYLSPLEQLQMSILAGVFYLSMFENADEAKENQLKHATRVARVVNVPVSQVLELIEPLPGLQCIDDFIAAIKSAIVSSRTESISRALLYGMVSGDWFGPNAREVVAVSLEHPPTFIAMVYEALTNRTFHKSNLAQIVTNCDKQNMGKVFIQAVHHLLGK